MVGGDVDRVDERGDGLEWVVELGVADAQRVVAERVAGFVLDVCS